MDELSKTVIDFVKCYGACAAGITTIKNLEGGPPSTDLTYKLPSAKSAVCFAYPLNQGLIPSFLAKKNHLLHERDVMRADTLATGLALQLADFLNQKGHLSIPVSSNAVYRTDTPRGFYDLIPDISLRYLAVRSGIGHFGCSGNVMPEEIMTDHPERLRTVIVSGTNPLRSFADTSAYEGAFKRLDLLVTVDITMTETAAVSHYVLPALSAYESWDGGVEVMGDFPGLFLQMRRPVVEPVGEQIEAGEIFLRLADRLGLVPDIPGTLYETADEGDRAQFGRALMEFLQDNPGAGKGMPYILAKTLGKKLGSGHLGLLWGLLQNLPPAVHEMAARMGIHPGPGLGEEVFQAVLKHPEGLWLGEADRDHWDHFQMLATKDGRINLDVPEMADWIQELDPALESERLREGEDGYPLIMSSGRHMDYNANTQMRDPAWNQGKRACTALMHPGDAEKLEFMDGQMVKVATETGEEKIELQVTKATRPGYIMIPHGFGLVYQGDIYGANANRLSKNTHRDRIAGTPLHRYIRCRVEAL